MAEISVMDEITVSAKQHISHSRNIVIRRTELKKDTNSVFAKNLNRLMTEKSITVERAADVAGVSKSNIVSWRSGVAPTNFDAVKKLSEFFGVSFSFLLTGEEADYVDNTICTIRSISDV